MKLSEIKDPKLRQRIEEQLRAQTCRLGRTEPAQRKPHPAKTLEPARPGKKGNTTGVGSVVVTLVRLGPRKLDDDNLAGAFKVLRDAVAESLGVDDGDPVLNWRYGQVISPTQSALVILETL